MTDDIPDYDIDELLEHEPSTGDIAEMTYSEIGRLIAKKGKLEDTSDETMLIRCPDYYSGNDYNASSGDICICSLSPMPTPDGDMKMACHGPVFRYNIAEDTAYQKTDKRGISCCTYNLEYIMEG